MAQIFPVLKESVVGQNEANTETLGRRAEELG